MNPNPHPHPNPNPSLNPNPNPDPDPDPDQVEPHAIAAALARSSKEVQACFATILSDDEEEDAESPTARKRRPSGGLGRSPRGSPRGSPSRGGGARWGEVAATHAGCAQQVRYAAG